MLIGVAVLALATDIVTKVIVVAQLSDRDPIKLLGGFLTLTVTRNSGAAFSVGTSATALFTLIAAGVVIAIVRTARHLYSVPWAIVLGLLLSGACGNLVDRIFRSPGVFRGHVIDWIEVPHYPVFNIADSCICVGGVLAVILAARGFQLDGGKAPEKSPEKKPSGEKS